MADMIMKANSAEKPGQLMSHLLAAQQIWLHRCKGESAIGIVLWPDWQADTLVKRINDNHRAWINFLDYSQPDDFDKVISYKTLRGEGFENTLRDILTHVINHGTHHRAQAGQHLKITGAYPPFTDYVLYLRTLTN